MKRLSIIIGAAIISVILLVSLGVYYQGYILRSEQREVERYAQVIANSLWRLDPQGPADFLSLIAQRQYYKRLVVYDTDGSVFLEVGGQVKGWLDRMLIDLGLMGPTEISAPVKYQGKLIGRIAAVWYPSSIYFYLYAFVIVLLVLTTLWFFMRTVEAKRTLEANVRDRTRDLRETNRSLQAEITEREQMEHALRESEAKLRTVLDSNPDPLVVYDIEGKITYFNPAFTRVFGWTLEERIGKRMDQFVPQENWPETRVMIDKVLAGESFSGVETRRYTKFKKIVPVSVSGAIYLDGQGNPTGSVINLRDISDQKRLEDEFRQAQKMEAIGTLAGGIAHDFNNILQAIGGYVQLLHRDPLINDHNRAQLNQIEHATERASGLVKRLLSFSRKTEPNLKPVDLNQEINQTVELLERTIPKMITISTNLSKELEPVKLDPDQLAQLLMNLGANARDAMPQGGILGIETRSLQLEPGDALMDMAPGRYVQLSFSDTGVGMPPRVLEHIFDPFFTTKEVGQGTGLGLSTVYGIVKSHHGYITCDSQPGMGTTFNIYFPALVGGHIEVAQARRPRGEVAGGRETILLVDDESPVRDIGKEALSQFGYTVLLATSGEEALEVYRKTSDQVDLIILDLGMPGMGGMKCMKEILAFDAQAKVMVASGYTADSQRKDALEAGARAFLAKPYRLNSLLSTVREVLTAND